MACVIEELVNMGKSKSFKVLTPDTDVVFLIINYLAASCREDVTIDVTIMTSKGNRKIRINKVVSCLGRSKAMALLGSYVCTGCDHIGRFGSISKARAFKVFSELDEHTRNIVLGSLQSLGTSTVLSETHIINISRYVILMYCNRRTEDKRFENVADVGSLRWEFYSKYQTESSDLPPTPAALKQHLIRSNYVALMWKRGCIDFNQNVPTPGPDFAWSIDTSKLSAIMSTELPAPEFAIELTKCNCKITKCGGRRCVCVRLGLKCTDVCSCVDCTNVDLRFDCID